MGSMASPPGLDLNWSTIWDSVSASAPGRPAVSIYGSIGAPFPTPVDEIATAAADLRIPAPVTLTATPLMHAMAMFNTMNTLVLGGTVEFLDSPGFDPRGVLRAIVEQRVTRLIVADNAVAVPLGDALDEDADVGRNHDLSSIQLVVSSDMAWSDAAKERLLRHFDTRLFDIVGASEGDPFAHSSVWSTADLPSVLRLAADAVVLDGGVGQLTSRGPMPLGHFEDEAKTAEVYRGLDGRRHVIPGDWVRLFDGNRIEFLDPGSAVVNTGGEKDHPAEVEGALLALPEMVDCVVFGVPDDRSRQVVAEVVQPAPDATFTPDAVVEFLGGTLAGCKEAKAHRARLLSHPQPQRHVRTPGPPRALRDRQISRERNRNMIQTDGGPTETTIAAPRDLIGTTLGLTCTTATIPIYSEVAAEFERGGLSPTEVGREHALGGPEDVAPLSGSDRP